MCIYIYIYIYTCIHINTHEYIYIYTYMCIGDRMSSWSARLFLHLALSGRLGPAMYLSLYIYIYIHK